MVASWHYADCAIALIRCIPSCAGQQYVFVAGVFVLVPFAGALAGAFGWCFWLVPFAGAFGWYYVVRILLCA